MWNIGDKVWYASFKSETKYAPCPECEGDLFVCVRIHDGTEYTIPCETCKQGYLGPRGTVSYYEQEPRAKNSTITSISQDASGFEYKIREYSSDGGAWDMTIETDRIFDDEQSAVNKAAEISIEHNEKEHSRKLSKTKENKSWAWHVTYHRKELKRAQKQAVYHESQLNYAKAKAKTNA